MLGVPAVRRRSVSPIALRAVAPLLPRMSETEQVALESGTVWFDGQLFTGDPDWTRWLQQPPYLLSPEERAFLDGPVEELCAMVSDWDTVQETDLSPAAWDFIKEHGFWGMIIPREHGGLGFSAAAHSAVIAKLSSRSTALAVTVMVPNSLGPAELLLHYGTEAQKAHYLPRLARGEEIPCFALTEPNAGSDAGGMRSRGIVTRGKFEGREVLGMTLTWDKRYITLAPVATIIGLAFKLYDPDHLLGDREA
ncbi:MAG: acyl-CoA dehydrogenase family protein, partial [Candidatus Eisenbacteria bacterium]|nr:acyl-CoA dehydrogenase family protein [Candidatus Eisenbacteria bacterium]